MSALTPVLRLVASGECSSAASPRSLQGRFLALHLPAFRLERCGYGANDLAVLVTEQKNATRIIALTPAARNAGLREQMTCSEARALHSEVMVEPWEPIGEREDQASLARMFSDLSDQVQMLRDDTLVMEIGATAHLFGGEVPLLQRVRSRARAWGHTCCLAVTDHPLVSTALAGWGEEDRVVSVGESAEALASLPLTALSLSPTLRDALTLLGIERIGQWAALEPASVASRYGEEGIALHRVARGVPPRLWSVRQGAEETLFRHVVLGEPTSTLEPMKLALSGMLAELCAELRVRDRAMVSLRLRLELDWGKTTAPLRVRFGRPARQTESIERILWSHLERLRLRAPVTELNLEVDEVASMNGWQPGLMARVESVEPLPDLIARMTHVLGEGVVFVPALVERWRPEAAWTRSSEVARVGAPKPIGDPVAVQFQWERERLDAVAQSARPTLMLESARPLRVILQDEQPVSMHTAEGSFVFGKVCGPERLQGEWWLRDGGFDRDYWVVETQDGPVWIFRERDQWFLQGYFD